MSLNQSKKKRDDLQIWRCLAIIGVLLFHIWPETFKNGYLGVDIFFVLSGYLMASIVSRNAAISREVCVDFYFRRIKRIVPVYLAVLLLVIVLLSRAVYLIEFETILKDSYWAVGFVTNIQDAISKLDYFDMQSRHRYFRHCWSIAVEMQFYLLVPAMFSLWMNFFPQFKLSILLAFTLASMIWQFTARDAFTQYESTISRIWQFSFGIMAQAYSLKRHQSAREKVFCFCLLILCCFLMFVPMTLKRNVVSVLATMIAAFLIATSLTDQDSPFDQLIKTRFLGSSAVFIGDISYVMYLVHWPIITYFRFVTSDRFSLLLGVYVAFLTVLASVVCHYLVEKPSLEYVKSKCSLVTCMALLYLLLFSVPLLLQNYMQFGETADDKTLDLIKKFYRFDEPAEIPADWTEKDRIKLAITLMNQKACYIDCQDTQDKFTAIPLRAKMHFCETFNPHAITNFTAVIVGNSHGIHTGPLIHNSKKFRHVYRVSGSGCPFPDPHFHAPTKFHCPDIHTISQQVIEKVKPDVVFVISATLFAFSAKLRGPIEDDKAFKLLDKYVAQTEGFTKAIVFSGNSLRFDLHITPEFLRRIRSGLDLEDMKYRRKKVVVPEADTTARFTKLSEKWPKTLFFEPAAPFCDKEYCYGYDPTLKMPMFSDHTHHTVMGLRSYYPYMDSVIDRALKVAGLI